MAVRLAFAVIAHVNADILIVDEALSVGDVFFNQKCSRFINRFREQGTLLFVSHDAAAVTSMCDQALLLDQGKQTLLGTPKKVLEEYTKQLYASSQTLTDSDQAEDSTHLINEDKSEWIDYRTAIINKSDHANLFTITKFDESSLSRKILAVERHVLSPQDYWTAV